MAQSNTLKRHKPLTAFPNLFFITTFCIILVFEVIKYGLRPFAFGVTVGWFLLPFIGVIYYNCIFRDTSRDRRGVMILTGAFFTLWVVGRLLG